MPRSVLLAVACALVLALAGCASPLDDADAGVPREDVVAGLAPDPALAAMLPPQVRAGGVLKVGASTGSQPPTSFFLSDSRTAVGLDVDMTEAVARLLGLRVTRTESTFDGTLPGLGSGKFDVGTGNFGVTEARKRVVDFVTYINDGQGFAVRADDPQGPVTDLIQLCGRTVSVQAGSTFEATLSRAAPRCATVGRPPMDVASYPDGPTTSLALVQRRADVTMSTINGLRYLTAHQPRLRFVGEYRRLDVGFVLAKNSPLAPAMQAAVDRLIADGTYRRILEKWGTESSALTSSRINPPEPA